MNRKPMTCGYTNYYGKKITEAKLTESSVKLKFEDGISIKITDEGQSCCEARYMRTDDDFNSIIGHTLLGIHEKEVSGYNPIKDDGDCHEIVFLEISTSGGSIVFSTHNEHNGYYGGFDLKIVELN